MNKFKFIENIDNYRPKSALIGKIPAGIVNKENLLKVLYELYITSLIYLTKIYDHLGLW